MDEYQKKFGVRLISLLFLLAIVISVLAMVGHNQGIKNTTITDTTTGIVTDITNTQRGILVEFNNETLTEILMYKHYGRSTNVYPKIPRIPPIQIELGQEYNFNLNQYGYLVSYGLVEGAN